MSLTSGSCAAAAQRRMGHGNLAQCWAVLPWREGIHPLMEGKHGKGETFIICARRTFICLSKTEPHFEEDTGGWSDGTEDRKHSQAGAFNSPDHFISPSTSLGSPVYCCYSEQVLDCNVPAAPLFWVFSTFRLFHCMSQIQKEISQSHGSYVLTQQHCSGSLKKKEKKACHLWLRETGKFLRNISFRMLSNHFCIKVYQITQNGRGMHIIVVPQRDRMLYLHLRKLSFTTFHSLNKQQMQNDQLQLPLLPLKCLQWQIRMRTGEHDTPTEEIKWNVRSKLHSQKHPHNANYAGVV